MKLLAFVVLAVALLCVGEARKILYDSRILLQSQAGSRHQRADPAPAAPAPATPAPATPAPTPAPAPAPSPAPTTAPAPTPAPASTATGAPAPANPAPTSAPTPSAAAAPSPAAAPAPSSQAPTVAPVPTTPAPTAPAPAAPASTPAPNAPSTTGAPSPAAPAAPTPAPAPAPTGTAAAAVVESKQAEAGAQQVKQEEKKEEKKAEEVKQEVKQTAVAAQNLAQQATEARKDIADRLENVEQKMKTLHQATIVDKAQVNEKLDKTAAEFVTAEQVDNLKRYDEERQYPILVGDKALPNTQTHSTADYKSNGENAALYNGIKVDAKVATQEIILNHADAHFDQADRAIPEIAAEDKLIAKTPAGY